MNNQRKSLPLAPKPYLTLAAVCILLQVLVTPADAANVEEETQLWQGIAEGKYMAIMRHALAPGMGDPDEFQLFQCETQRNLSAEGTEQAQRIGNRFRKNGIPSMAVYSSQWCRCRDTAEALNLGSVVELEPLNSFFQNFELREPQSDALRKWIQNQTHDKPVILVTHQVNISALLGVGATSGEIVVFRLDADGVIVPVGSIVTP